MNTEFDVVIVIGRRHGRRQPMRISFTPSGIRKLKARAPAFHEHLQNIENDLAKDIFPAKNLLLCTDISFEADDPDLADLEARDIADEFLSRMRFSARIVDENRLARAAA